MSKDYEVYFYVKVDCTVKITADSIESAIKKAEEKLNKDIRKSLSSNSINGIEVYTRGIFVDEQEDSLL